MFSSKITNNTLVDYPRLIKLNEYCKETYYVPRSVAEVEVYKGGTAYLLCERTNKPVFLFDTFEGMPEVNKAYDLHNTGDFKDTSKEQVQALLSEFDNPVFFKGVFPNSTWDTSGFVQLKFSLVHLDCDIYNSVKNCLEWFYPRMTRKGIIVLDDYNEPNCPGAKKAANDFMQDKPQKIIETVQSQAIIRI